MIYINNTLLAAYDFGNIVSNSASGKKLFIRYNAVKNQLSPESWSIFQQVIKTCSFSHYCSFGMAYKKIEAISSKKEIYYEKYFKELQNCNELHLLIEEADQVGKALEESFIQMFKKLPSRNISSTINSFELYRSWMNIFYHLHSTKLMNFLYQHKISLENQQGNIQEFLKTKENTPFSRNNRIIIRKLAVNEKEKNMMYSLDFFDTLRNSILQIIFETHFELIFKLNKDKIVKYKEKQRNQIRVFSTKTLGIDVFRNQGVFILFLESNIVKEIGLIKTSVGRNIELGDKAITIINGVLYPQEDYNLLLKI